MQYRMHARTPFECTNYELRSHTGCTQNEKCQQCTCLTLYLLPTRENGSEYTLTNIFTKKKWKKVTKYTSKIAFFFSKNNYGTMADYRKQSSSRSCQPLSKGALTIVPMLGGSFGELLTFRGWWPRVEAVNPPHWPRSTRNVLVSRKPFFVYTFGIVWCNIILYGCSSLWCYKLS